MPDRIQVLIVEDDAVDAELLAIALRRAGFVFDWTRVDSEQEYLGELDRNPDLIFSDCKMPQFSGFRALELLKQRGLKIPFIVLSGSIDASVAADVLEKGATDCLVKGSFSHLKKTVDEALGLPPASPGP